jgi:hypothetical protein
LHFTVARFGLASTGGSANDGAQWIEWSVSVSDSNQDDVAWDGDALVGWIVVNGAKTKIRATREMIHEHAAGFNDAVTWEIERHRVEIFERLRPVLTRMLATNSGQIPRHRKADSAVRQKFLG